MCVLQLVVSVQVLWASPVHPGGGLLRGDHPSVWGLSIPPPIWLHRVSTFTRLRTRGGILLVMRFCCLLSVNKAKRINVQSECLLHVLSFDTFLLTNFIFLGQYATPLCPRPSPYPSRLVSGPTRRTTATSLASGTARPPLPMSISIPSSLSTLMWVCSLFAGLTDKSMYHML